MAKKKGPELPNVPQFQEDPRFTQGLDQLFSLGGKLTTGDFSGTGLEQAISTSPEMSQLFFQGLQAQMNPAFRDIRKSITSELAANNQLESSVLGNRLLQSETDLQSMFTKAGTEFGIRDIDRALQNRVSLFGSGLDVLGGATGAAQIQGANRNVFNLENFENEFGLYQMEQSQQGGGLMGGLGGAIGGGALGAGLSIAAAPFTGGASLALLPAVAGFGAIGGGAMGYFGKQGTGSNILQAGASSAPLFARRSASNDAFGRELPMFAQQGGKLAGSLEGQDMWKYV